jgi:uncharacterized protein (TIGR03437 family)
LNHLSTNLLRICHTAANRTGAGCLAAAGLFLLPVFTPAQTPPSFVISTVAGNATSGFSGDSGAAISAQLAGPYAVTVDKSGNFYIADQFNNRIRKVDTSGNITTVAGNGTAGYTGDGAAATSAEINTPGGILADGAGNLYISDTGNSVIRKVTSGGTISTIAGNYTAGPGFAGDGAAATAAQLNHPSGLAIDSSGNIYIADTSNNAIRVVLPNGNIATVAGYGVSGFSGDGGLATSAKLNNPIGVAVDRNNNLVIADGGNHRIRTVSGNIITTIAGSSSAGGYSGDGGLATKAKLNTPKGVATDSGGNLYIVDTFNSVVRIVTPDGNINTIAGNGSPGYGGDGSNAVFAQLFFPTAIALDASGKVYIADNQSNVIRLLTPSGSVAPSINAIQSAGAFGAFSSIAPGGWIEIFGTNISATSRSWGGADFSGVNAPTSLDGISVSIGGQAAFVSYISATQVNAQVPSNVATGSQTLTIKSPGGTSSAKTVTVTTTQPGILAPASFNVGGNQYAGALFSDASTYVMPTGAVSGVTSRPAKPGETITFYGVGFGAVNPDIPAGRTVAQANSLVASFVPTIGGVNATTSYAGLAPGAIGLYQFNIVVPNVPNSDLVPFKFTLGGVAGTQSLYIAVHN